MNQTFINDASETRQDVPCYVTLSAGLQVMGMSSAADQVLGAKPGQTDLLEHIFDGVSLNRARSTIHQVLEHGRAMEGIRGHFFPQGNRTGRFEYDLQPLYQRDRQIIGVILSLHGLSAHVGVRPSGRSVDYNTLFETLPLGIFTVDAHWRIKDFNRSAERFTGFRRKEVMGRHCWEVFRTPLCRGACPMRLAFEQDDAQIDLEVTITCRAGGRRPMLMNVGLLKDDYGRIIGAVHSFHPTQASLIQPSMKAVYSGEPFWISESMRNLMDRIPDVASSRANVLICGESGTGKEVLARSIHQISSQANAPFMVVNCAALPETLLEAELFGYEKGAFTGADHNHPGRFELVGNGTLVLDEIAELKPELQIKLLRVLEDRKFERVGGIRPITLRARIISATHQDLDWAIREKRFRQDLYYRLRTVPLLLPPLRDRMEDIPILVEHFIAKYNLRTGKQVRALDPKVLNMLCTYCWPGNVRELERAIEYAFVFVKGPVIFQRHLPEMTRVDQKIPQPPDRTVGRSAPPGREEIESALSKTGGRPSAAARLLRISRTSLWRYMKKYSLP